MNWIQLSAIVDPTQAEALEESLLAAGASAVTMVDAADQPILEPALGTTPIWNETRVIGLFSAEEDIDDAQKIARAVFNEMASSDCPNLVAELLENEDWTRKWIENFKPIHFGNRLCVCPSWEETPNTGAINLLLEPGLAFGTGTHPTTALCLEWLDATNLNEKTIVDFGCGSGILGIAALLLGATKVIAIDNDPQALVATRDNAERNNIQPQNIETYLPEDAPRFEADIVIANILAQPLHDLKDSILSYLKPKGSLVMSGVLSNQSEALAQKYSDQVDIDPIATQENWTRVSGKRK
jgi:ribosomal protein L11 methyltransferase